ncbi:MAG: serine/threonine-protein kinase [Kofleriaceae bacterium]
MKDEAKTVDDRPGPPRAAAAIAPRDEVGAEIARGGMGRVVEAVDTVLGRTVAVKEALAGGGEATRRFRREIAITARLEHPSIVPVHDAGTLPDGSPFYVMRKVSGRPLTELIGAAATLEQRLALLPHVVAAAQAIAHAHKRGVVHRDVKPSNILVGELGDTVVIDWGLAKVIGEPEQDDPHAAEAMDAGTSLRTRIGSVFGTPGFMAPEQVRGEAVDARSDVYALGATLYYTFTRQPPHASASVSETEMMSAAASGPAQPIGEVVERLPRELSTIVDKALAFDERVRYPHAGALAEDLQRFLTGQLVASHEYSRRERIARFVRRNRVAVGVAAVALVTVAVGGALAVRSIVAARDRADVQARLAVAGQRDAEEARAREQQRGDQLLLLQAQGLAETNPTAAVALVKQLTQPAERWDRMWHQVRAIAATASFHGVVHALPAPIATWRLEISPATTRAASRDRTGHVTIYDLVALTSAAAALPETDGMTFADEEHLVAYTGTALYLIDLPSGARREVALTRRVSELVATARAVYFYDEGPTLTRLDLATLSSRKLDLGAPIKDLALSNDRRWLALALEHEVVGLDLDHDEAIKHLGAASTVFLRWSSDSLHLTSAVLYDVITFNLDGSPPTRRKLDSIVVDALMLEHRTYFNTSAGLFVTNGTALQALTHNDRNDTGSMFHDMSGLAVLARNDEIEVFDPDHRFMLHSPTGPIGMVASSPSGRRIAATSAGHLLVWDLDSHYPAGARFAQATTFVMVGNNNALVLPNDGGWTWLDFKQATDKTLPMLFAPFSAIATGFHATAAAATVVDKPDEIHVLRGGSATTVHEKMVSVCILADDRVAMTTAAGEVVTYDQANHRTVLFRHAGTAPELASASTWLVAGYRDGTVVRIDLTTSRVETLELALPRDARVTISIAPDGTVFPSVGRALMRWQRDGILLLHTMLPIPMAARTRCRSRRQRGSRRCRRISTAGWPMRPSSACSRYLTAR